jgi:hypothetical protein
LIRLVRQSTTVPNTSNTSAFTADTSDMRGPPVFSFRHSGAMRSIEPGIHFAYSSADGWILWCAIAHHSSRQEARPGMTVSLNPGETCPAGGAPP